MKTAFLSIDFKEGNQLTYRGIDVQLDEEKVRFDTGNITVDFIDYIHWIGDRKFEYVCYSSSWNHFFMDGKKYKRLYINHFLNNKVITDLNDCDNAIEYPVPLEINSFKELKKYYKKHR